MPDDEFDEETTVLKQLIKLNEKSAKNNELQVEMRNIAIQRLNVAIEQRDVAKAILTVKKTHHNDWMKATTKRFYISFIAAMLTGAVLYLDVLKLDESSVIVAGAIDLLSVVKGLL